MCGGFGGRWPGAVSTHIFYRASYRTSNRHPATGNSPTGNQQLPLARSLSLPGRAIHGMACEAAQPESQDGSREWVTCYRLIDCRRTGPPVQGARLTTGREEKRKKGRRRTYRRSDSGQLTREKESERPLLVLIVLLLATTDSHCQLFLISRFPPSIHP